MFHTYNKSIMDATPLLMMPISPHPISSSTSQHCLPNWNISLSISLPHLTKTTLGSTLLMMTSYTDHTSPILSQNFPAAQTCSSLKASCCCLNSAFIMSINHHPAFPSADVQYALQIIQDEGMYKTIDITIAPEMKLSIQDVRKAANDYRLFAPTTKWDDTLMIAEEEEEEEDPLSLERKHIKLIDKVKCTLAPTEDDLKITTPILDTHTLRAISKLHHRKLWPAIWGSRHYHQNHQDVDQCHPIQRHHSRTISPKILFKEEIQDPIDLGPMTQRQNQTTESIWRPTDVQETHAKHIVLWPHWQYNVKRDSTRRVRLCCHGSKNAVPILHALAF